MKTLGIVGGIAPESTVEYYRQFIASYRRQRPDGSYPPLIINSINMTRMLDLIGAGELEEVTGYLASEVERLARAGAELGLMASNTPHIVFDEVARRASIPLVSIVEAAGAAAKAQGLRRVGLFGTRFTMQGRFYPDVFAQQGIEVAAPGLEDQDYIHDKYMNELVLGVFEEETRLRLLDIVDKMIEWQEIQGLVLGGTELPLILRGETYHGIPLLDTTRIHVERALAEALA